jgi:hypothetical protein
VEYTANMQSIHEYLVDDVLFEAEVDEHLEHPSVARRGTPCHGGHTLRDGLQIIILHGMCFNGWIISKPAIVHLRTSSTIVRSTLAFIMACTTSS